MEHVISPNEEQAHIVFDPADLEGMLRLMDERGDSNTMYPGKNKNGEDVYISIFTDGIVTATSQSNRWLRKNIYYRNGSREEIFER